MTVLTLNAAAAATLARDWRRAARTPGLNAREIYVRLERAATYQALAVCGIHGHSDRSEESA
jgi:hypothetical protein